MLYLFGVDLLWLMVIFSEFEGIFILLFIIFLLRLNIILFI